MLGAILGAMLQRSYLAFIILLLNVTSINLAYYNNNVKQLVFNTQWNLFSMDTYRNLASAHLMESPLAQYNLTLQKCPSPSRSLLLNCILLFVSNNDSQFWIIVKHFIMSLWLGWLLKHSLCLTLNLHLHFLYQIRFNAPFRLVCTLPIMANEERCYNPSQNRSVLKCSLLDRLRLRVPPRGGAFPAVEKLGQNTIG